MKHPENFPKLCQTYQQICIASAFFRENACFIKYIYYLCNVIHSETHPQGFNN